VTHVCDPAERAIVNGLQGGFPLSRRPFRDAGARIGLGETETIGAIGRLLESGRLSRFGPLWNIEPLGGAVCLCAMQVPQDRFERVAACVNAHPEVAHNYERMHAFNMWFVISVESEGRVRDIVAAIEAETGLDVHPMPKLREFFVGFRLEI
jgi:DNA-binding Lrp family transcriptional regulator